MIVLKTEPEFNSRHVLNIGGRNGGDQGKNEETHGQTGSCLDETTSSERLTALVEESDALDDVVAEEPVPPGLLRVLSRSEDEATRKNVILNPFTPYDVLSELENQFTELFVNNPALESYNSMKL